MARLDRLTSTVRYRSLVNAAADLMPGLDGCSVSSFIHSFIPSFMLSDCRPESSQWFFILGEHAAVFWCVSRIISSFPRQRRIRLNPGFFSFLPPLTQCPLPSPHAFSTGLRFYEIAFQARRTLVDLREPSDTSVCVISHPTCNGNVQPLVVITGALRPVSSCEVPPAISCSKASVLRKSRL